MTKLEKELLRATQALVSRLDGVCHIGAPHHREDCTLCTARMRAHKAARAFEDAEVFTATRTRQALANQIAEKGDDS